MTRELGKWPRLVIVGEPVTPEQASVILIRTQVYGLSGWDDREWKCRAEKALGLPDSCVFKLYQHDPEGVNAIWHDEDDAWERLGCLRLNYLWNDRIVNGATHGQGWCTWDGRIGDTRWNVGGKWPEIGEVTEEWRLIAEAFPFLRLSCQVVADLGADGYGGVAAQWHVADGLVRQVDIGPLLAEVEEDPWHDGVPERDITLEQLNRAVRWTLESLNPQVKPLYSA